MYRYFYCDDRRLINICHYCLITLLCNYKINKINMLINLQYSQVKLHRIGQIFTWNKQNTYSLISHGSRNEQNRKDTLQY